MCSLTHVPEFELQTHVGHIHSEIIMLRKEVPEFDRHMLDLRNHVRRKILLHKQSSKKYTIL